MKKTILVLILSLLVCSTAEAQKRKKKPATSRSAQREQTSSQANANTPRIIGSPVLIITKNDDRINGTLLALTAYSVRIRSGTLESTIALDTIASLSFGESAPPVANATHMNAPIRDEFLRDADAALAIFQTVASQLRSGADYTEFGRQLAELRRSAERFIDKHSVSDNPVEAKVVALLSGALTDYTWARTIWTLKLGRSGDGTVYESDSPAVSDALSLYADLRAAATAGNKFSADKLVSGLWKKAEEKTERARSAMPPAR